MNLRRGIMRAYTGSLHGGGRFLARRLKQKFYLYLAALLTLICVLDVLVLHQFVELRQKSYDFVIKHRLLMPKPDADIVIIDINEASLATLAKEYGRWPWPRQVLGEFLEQLEQQQPKAVIFDILFSDADVYNPDSDTYFNDAVAATDNTFFPLLRLPPESDPLSDLTASMIPGVTAIPGVAQQERKVAVVLPHFDAIVQSARLGTHNIYPDSDGIVRSYRLVHDLGGWKLPALPLRVAETLGWKSSTDHEILLNWRGPPFTYRYVSFSDVYQDFLSRERKRPQHEFRDKIVLIGSTAPSLFDIKPTSTARQFPGVEILATAIDNLKHRDWIRVPASRIPYLAAALLILWGTAWGFYRDMEPERLARLFGLSQIGLLAISYLTINLTNFFFNLTGPVTIGFLYFSIAKVYALATARALERNVVTESLQHDHGEVGTIAVFQVHGEDDLSAAMVMRALKRNIEKLGGRPKDVEILRGKQRGLFGLLEGTLAVSWVHAGEDSAQGEAVQQEVARLVKAMPALLDRARIGAEKLVGHAVMSATLGADGRQVEPGQWRQLLGEALTQLEEKVSHDRGEAR